MTIYFRRLLFCAVASCLLLLASCKKDDPPLPDNETAFESDQLGMSSAENEITIKVTLTRSASAAGTVNIGAESEGVSYGTDFTTDPASTANALVIPVPSGATEVSFKLQKVASVLFDGDESVKFTILSTTGGLVIGEKKELTVSFAEIVSTGSSMEVSGGGATYPNKVFIDLSGNRQTSVNRTTWDFGFASGADFRVILNSSNGMMVRVLDKNNLNDVTAADTVGFGAQLSIAAVFAAITSVSPPAWVEDAIEWIDDPTGDLTKTAIAEVSATLAENKVYIVNRGDGPGAPAPNLGWKKIRIVRNGDNYTLQHADIGATNFSEVQITKNPEFRFQYISLGTGAVEVEPSTERWDFAWTGFTNSTDFGSGPVPYYFQDMILLNTNAKSVKVMTSTKAYDAFAEADLAGLTFSSSQTAIGSDWRSGGGPTTAPSIRTDRYYVIQDPDGNYYKVRFTALTTNGERGKPQFEFSLVKKGV